MIIVLEPVGPHCARVICDGVNVGEAHDVGEAGWIVVTDDAHADHPMRGCYAATSVKELAAAIYNCVGEAESVTINEGEPR